MATLEYRHDGFDRSVDLGRGVVLIGRSPDCDVTIASESVSRRHAQIRAEGAEFLVEDLGSRNGTRVGGLLLTGPRALREGDAIVVGGHALVFRDGHAPEEPDLTVTMIAAEPASSTIVSTIDASVAAGHVCRMKPERALAAVLDVTRQIGQKLDLRNLLARVLDSLFELYPHADRGVILLRDAETGELRPEAARSRRPGDREVVVSRTVVLRAMEQRRAILSTNPTADDSLAVSESLLSLPIHSLMCVPLMSPSDQPLGVVELHSETAGGEFTPT